MEFDRPICDNSCAMSRSRYLALITSFLCCLLAACSGKTGPVEESGAKSTTAAKPRLDFGTVTITPKSGSGREGTFHLTVSGGSQKPSFVGLLINSTQDGGNACYVMQNFAVNDTMLVADSGSGTVAAAGQKPLANHQCEVLRDGTTSAVDTTGTNVTFHIRFTRAFAGAKHMWGVPADLQGNVPEMTMLGDWTVQ
jgi:hypothetical protein